MVGFGYEPVRSPLAEPVGAEPIALILPSAATAIVELSAYIAPRTAAAVPAMGSCAEGTVPKVTFEPFKLVNPDALPVSAPRAEIEAMTAPVELCHCCKSALCVGEFPFTTTPRVLSAPVLMVWFQS